MRRVVLRVCVLCVSVCVCSAVSQCATCALHTVFTSLYGHLKILRFILKYFYLLFLILITEHICSYWLHWHNLWYQFKTAVSETEYPAPQYRRVSIHTGTHSVRFESLKSVSLSVCYVSFSLCLCPSPPPSLSPPPLSLSLSLCAVLSFEYFVAHRVSEPYFSSSSSFFKCFFFPLSSGFGSDFKMIIYLFIFSPLPPPPTHTLIIIFFIITPVVSVVTIVLCVAYWHVD